MKKIKVLPLYKDGSGAEYHRIKLPIICSSGFVDTDPYVDYTSDRMIEFIKMSDLVIWNRVCPIDLKEMISLRDSYGFKIVVDVDDWIDLPVFNPHYDYYKRVAGPAIKEAMQIADLVTVTTERLRQRCGEFNASIVVFPNAIPFNYGQFMAPPIAKRDTFDFVYAGAASHLEDVKLLETPLRQLRNVPDVSLTFAGYQRNKTVPRQINGYVSLKASISKATVNEEMDRVLSIMQPRYHRIDFAPLDSYMKSYDQSHCSLVPLKTDSFNFHKSNLKLIEAGAKRIPAIVSAVPPYTDEDCKESAPVMWVASQQDWIFHMRTLARDREFAKQQGEILYQWARKYYNMASWIPVRYHVYNNLLNDLPLETGLTEL